MNRSDEYFTSGYVWIILGWYHDQWWTEAVSQDNTSVCNDSLIEPLIFQTIAIQQTNFALDEDGSTDVNLVINV